MNTPVLSVERQKVDKYLAIYNISCSIEESLLDLSITPKKHKGLDRKDWDSLYIIFNKRTKYFEIYIPIIENDQGKSFKIYRCKSIGAMFSYLIAGQFGNTLLLI